jgi:hypothetical protein
MKFCKSYILSNLNSMNITKEERREKADEKEND